ncbi:hypothetical protein H5410_060011, partial [Solanum commersonii]
MALKKEDGKIFLPFIKQANASEFPQFFWGVSLQEQPNKFYMALSRQRLVAEAESSMQTIMENLQSYRMKLAVNCEEFQYRLGDFRFRVSKVVPINYENLRGIVMEETSHLIMTEFFEIWKETLGKRSLPGNFVHVEPKFSHLGSNGSNISIITSNEKLKCFVDIIRFFLSFRNEFFMFINKLGICTSIVSNLKATMISNQ